MPGPSRFIWSQNRETPKVPNWRTRVTASRSSTSVNSSSVWPELDGFTGTSPAFAIMTSSFFDRQALLYQYVLESGAARGIFTLARPAETIARGLVALEDGLGLQVVTGHPAVDSAEAERILLSYAGVATGVQLEDVPIV
jgi:hypothetical protein